MGELTPYQRDIILPCLRRLLRDLGRATTGAIADRLGLPERSARRYMTQLETLNVVKRVRKRGGWQLTKDFQRLNWYERETTTIRGTLYQAARRY